MQKKTVDMIVGQKVEQAEADKNKSAKVGEGTSTPPKQGGEVGARGGTWQYVLCPWDLAVNHVYVDDDIYLWYRCWNCRGLFRV